MLSSCPSCTKDQNDGYKYFIEDFISSGVISFKDEWVGTVQESSTNLKIKTKKNSIAFFLPYFYLSTENQIFPIIGVLIILTI